MSDEQVLEAILIENINWVDDDTGSAVDAILTHFQRKPQQVTTVEELDALPDGSVILIPSAANVAIRDGNGDWALGGRQTPFTTAKVHKGLHGAAAMVLHVGGAE